MYSRAPKLLDKTTVIWKASLITMIEKMSGWLHCGALLNYFYPSPDTAGAAAMSESHTTY
jgi:hypothetical protein